MVKDWRRLTRITNEECEKKIGLTFKDLKTVFTVIHNSLNAFKNYTATNE